MSDDQAAADARSLEVFLGDVGETRRHIVDELILERCPSFAGHWTWPALRPALFTLLGYSRARKMADHLRTLNGEQSFEWLSRELELDVNTHRADRIPQAGRCIVAANHPTGLADGIAVWDALVKVRRDIVVFANADALRVNPNFTDIMIPVEWVVSKRSPAKTRETLRQAAEAFAAEKCVVIFPSGKLAREIDGELTEQDWFTTVVGLARKQSAPIVPLNVEARNSRLFYFLSRLNGELRDITLFHELLNKRGKRFDLTVGEPISPGDLEGPGKEVTEALRLHVWRELAADSDHRFEK